MEFASTPRDHSEQQTRHEAGLSETTSSPGGEPRRRAVLRSFRQLWRHRYFRRLLAVRVAVQSSDGVLQVGLAAYVLFSPERQPDAASIAIVLAITAMMMKMTRNETILIATTIASVIDTKPS